VPETRAPFANCRLFLPSLTAIFFFFSELSGTPSDHDLNEFNELLASADNAAFDVVAAAIDDDAPNGDLTMDLTTAVGAVVRNVAPIDDDQSMQLTAVVASTTTTTSTTSAKPSLFAMVEQLRDDALYDAETDSESENTAALFNATVPIGDDNDNQTRDMDETAAVGETRIVVKMQPTILSADGAPASADATMGHDCCGGTWHCRSRRRRRLDCSGRRAWRRRNDGSDRRRSATHARRRNASA
jgi:hypothetical protein